MSKHHIGWEWIAGFFEGPLQAISDFLVAQGFKPPQLYLRPASMSPRSRPCWMLAVCVRRDVIRMLDAILPWLFEKAEKARFVLARLRVAIEERDSVLMRAAALRASGSTWAEIAKKLGVGRTALSNFLRSAEVATPCG